MHCLTSETIHHVRFDLGELGAEVETKILEKCSEIARAHDCDYEDWASGPAWSAYAVFSSHDRAAVDRAATEAWQYAGRFKAVKAMREAADRSSESA